jgi:5-methylcytosine-specific restriction enzyme subunit McrC
MLRKNGKTVAIIDTKWKVIGNNISDKKRGVSQTDVYQMMAYGQLYGSQRLMLLYPSHSGLEESGTIANHRIATPGGARLDIATIDVTVERRHCVETLRDLLAPLVADQAGQSRHAA